MHGGDAVLFHWGCSDITPPQAHCEPRMALEVRVENWVVLNVLPQTCLPRCFVV